MLFYPVLLISAFPVAMTLPRFIPMHDQPQHSDFPLVVHYGKGKEKVLRYCSNRCDWWNAWNGAKRWLTKQNRGKIFTSDIGAAKGKDRDQTWCGYCVQRHKRGNYYEVISLDENEHDENADSDAVPANSMGI